MKGWRVFRAVVAIAGRPVLVRAVATFAAVGLPAAIIFSPQGMSARDLLRAMHESGAVAAVIWLGWLALSAVATNAVFGVPGMLVVRAARPSPYRIVPSLLALASVAQLPWAILWFRGAGGVAAVGAVLLAVAAAASLFALTRRWSVRAALVFAGALATGILSSASRVGAKTTLGDGVHAAAIAMTTFGAILSLVAVRLAWRVAPESRSEARVWTRASASPLLALATVYWLRLARAERLRLVLASMIGSLGAAGLLTLRSDPTPRPGGRAVAIMTVPLVVASALFIAPLLACEEGMRARLRVLRVRHAVVMGAFLLAVAVPTSAFAAVAGVATSAPVAPTTGWAIVLSAVVALWGRRHARMKKPRSSTFAVGVALIALVSVTLAMELL